MTKAKIKRITVVLDTFFRGLKIECVKDGEKFEVLKDMQFVTLDGLQDFAVGDMRNCTTYKKGIVDITVDFDYARENEVWNEEISSEFATADLTYAEADEIVTDALTIMCNDRSVVECRYPNYDATKNEKVVETALGDYKLLEAHIDAEFGGILLGAQDKKDHVFDLYAQLDADKNGNLYFALDNADNKFIYADDATEDTDIFANTKFSDYVTYEKAVDIVRLAISALATKSYTCVSPVFDTYEAE